LFNIFAYFLSYCTIIKHNICLNSRVWIVMLGPTNFSIQTTNSLYTNSANNQTLLVLKYHMVLLLIKN